MGLVIYCTGALSWQNEQQNCSITTPMKPLIVLVAGCFSVLSLTADEITIDPFANTGTPPSNLSISIEESPGGPEAVIKWTGQAQLQLATRIGATWRTVTTESPYRTSIRSRFRFYRTIPPGGRPTTVYVPSSYDSNTPAPLIISLHGFTLNPDSHERLIPLKPLSDSKGFIYVTPLGTAGSNGQTFWNALPECCDNTNSNRDDSGFFRRLILSIQEKLNIDPKRIHMVGHSNGGMMSYRMACEHSDLIASIASLAGATFKDTGDCIPSEPVSILQIHGTNDGVVAYNGGTFISATGNIETWRTYNQCGSLETDDHKTLDLDLRVLGIDTTITRVNDCPPGIGLELWSIAGGSHSPSASQNGNESQLAASLIDWLYAHPKP